MAKCTMALPCLLLAAAQIAAAGDLPKPIAVEPDGGTVHEFFEGGKRVRVAVKTVSVNIGAADPDRELPEVPARSNNCTYVKFPCSQLTNLSIWVGEIRLAVPRSAIADRTDVSSMSLTFESKLWMLTLFGGEGAQAYTLRLYFDGHRIRKRELRTSGNSLAESTEYSSSGE